MNALRAFLALGLGAIGLVAVLTTPSVATASEPAGDCYGEEATIVGSGTIVGTSGDDVILGSDGPDVIDGKAGHDVICGLGGDDVVHGGTGGDSIFGDEFEFDYACDEVEPIGDDTLHGDAGNDLIFDACGDNWAGGGSGNDYVEVSGTADGGSGSDFVRAYNGYYSCGEANEDCIAGHAKGGPANDQVTVLGGLAEGGSGDDFIELGRDGDEARGGPGRDTLLDLDNEATLNGGTGTDTCGAINPNTVKISCETT